MPIRTPDRRVRVFVSSTLEELAAERRAVAAPPTTHLTVVSVAAAGPVFAERIVTFGPTDRGRPEPALSRITLHHERTEAVLR